MFITRVFYCCERLALAAFHLCDGTMVRGELEFGREQILWQGKSTIKF